MFTITHITPFETPADILLQSFLKVTCADPPGSSDPLLLTVRRGRRERPRIPLRGLAPPVKQPRVALMDVQGASAWPAALPRRFVNVCTDQPP